MKCAILQPSYIPWRGYFHQIQKADVFVFLDDVQYDRRGWRNRNRIKTAASNKWLTIPALTKGHRKEGTTIRDLEICWDRPWTKSHWSALSLSYMRAPFFSRYSSVVESFYARRPTFLAEFTIDTTMEIARLLGITRTTYLRSSSLSLGGVRTERLLRILQAVGADHYISGPSASAYLDVEALAAYGIATEYMVYDYREYEQLHPPYDPAVTVLDLLFMKGDAAPRWIWG
jgi:hypothetical protein